MLSLIIKVWQFRYHIEYISMLWANSRPGCMNGLRKCYSHLVYLGSELVFARQSTDYCMLVNKWPWLR